VPATGTNRWLFFFFSPPIEETSDGHQFLITEGGKDTCFDRPRYCDRGGSRSREAAPSTNREKKICKKTQQKNVEAENYGWGRQLRYAMCQASSIVYAVEMTSFGTRRTHVYRDYAIFARFCLATGINERATGYAIDSRLYGEYLRNRLRLSTYWRTAPADRPSFRVAYAHQSISSANTALYADAGQLEDRPFRTCGAVCGPPPRRGLNQQRQIGEAVTLASQQMVRQRRMGEARLSRFLNRPLGAMRAQEGGHTPVCNG